MDQPVEQVRAAYEQVAEEYVVRLSHELEHKPLDRALLNYFAEEVRGRGLVCDLGCGPGHVARYLHEQGVTVQGIDLSPDMIKLARENNPGITFAQGNMLALDVPDKTWAGIVAFYSIVHLSRGQLMQALREMYRVLQPGGLLLLSFHMGQEVRHFDEWWGKAVTLDFIFFERTEVERYLREASFIPVASIERAPYSEFAVETQRAYLFVRRPGENEV